jgi:hypothetical protein
MPVRPPRACVQPGCPWTTPCPVHPPRTWAGRQMPPGWQATRRRILRRDPVCRACRLAPATEVHHTDPPAEDDDHLAGLCSPCHLVLTQAQAAEARRLAR